MKHRSYSIISYKEHTFDLMPAKTATFQTDPVALRFDDNAAARFGTKFYGYLIEIYEDGERIKSQSSPSTLVKYAGAIRNASKSKYSGSSTDPGGAFFQLK